jgi:hypothetical protein
MFAQILLGQVEPGGYDEVVIRQLGNSRIREHLYHLTDLCSPEPVVDAIHKVVNAARDKR